MLLIRYFIVFFWCLQGCAYEGLWYSQLYENNASIHLLEVDPYCYDMVIGRANTNCKEQVRDMAQRYNAIAAVNGGFFGILPENYGLPLNILKIENEWHATPHKARGAIGWSNPAKHVLFDRVLTTVTGQIGDQAFEIDGINRVRKDNQVMLYNRHFHQTLTCCKQKCLEFTIENDKITDIKKRNSKIPKEGFVLSIGSNKQAPFEHIQKDSPFKWSITVTSESKPAYTTSKQWSKVDFILGGFPILVRSGQTVNYDCEDVPGHIDDFKHPRTAVGILPNGHWLFVVVDGKNRNNSKGLTITEMGEFMQKIKCFDAINLDGGGCSIMILEDEIMNKPCGEIDDGSGHQLRGVADALLIIPRK